MLLLHTAASDMSQEMPRFRECIKRLRKQGKGSHILLVIGFHGTSLWPLMDEWMNEWMNQRLQSKQRKKEKSSRDRMRLDLLHWWETHDTDPWYEY
jgi:hypothetical protein